MKKSLSLRNLMMVALLTLLVAGSFLAGRVSADQPHMHKALTALQRANEELNAATPDKGGHREKAMNLVKDAMSEVQQGIEFDRKH